MKLGKQTPDHSGEHVTRSASRERRIGNFAAPEPTPITDDGSITFEHDDHWPTTRIEASGEGSGPRSERGDVAAMEFNASASSTLGRSSRSATIATNRSMPSGRPSPGPQTTACAPIAAS
jgi:hypothetical protein